MVALKRKWNSRRGASILLALLFLLVCMMVGASVLMAAASNVGKTQSNKKEQQKYLTVSSALTMLVNELENIEYVGQYEYTEKKWEQWETVPAPTPDNPDATTSVLVATHYKHTYTQVDGQLRLRKSDPGAASVLWGLKDVLPLCNDLDKIFADTIEDKYKGCGCSSWPPEHPDNIDHTEHYEHYKYIPQENPKSPKSPYELVFTVNSDSYGGLSEPVNIEANLRTDGSIFLTATLKGDGDEADFIMKALLRPVPDEWPEKQLILRGNETPNDDNEPPKIYETEVPIQWKLEYIFKQEVYPDATPAPATE